MRISDWSSDVCSSDLTVMVHPDTAAALGFGDGDRVRLGNDQGSVVLHAKLFDGVQPTTVIVESVWPNAAWEEGLGINVLTSADSPPPAGGAVFHGTAARMTRARPDATRSEERRAGK